jgi:hypothetical protein
MARKEAPVCTPKLGEGLKEITVHERFVLCLVVKKYNVGKITEILVNNGKSFSFEETVHKKHNLLRVITTTYGAEVIKQLIKGMYGK